MRLNWHNYNYYPYERELAAREAAALLGNGDLREIPGGLELIGGNGGGAVGRLTYFAEGMNGQGAVETLQSRLERTARTGRTRQATRYSVHGLHEYKGKFNPQIAKALLNIFRVGPGQRVLDPFCGSGTTLVECAHAGVLGHGVDLNPFAVFLASAKLQALAIPVANLQADLQRLASSPAFRRSVTVGEDSRAQYLRSWFTAEALNAIEGIRVAVEGAAGSSAPVFLAVASNLLRDYSLQDPKDLRVRRRRSPLPPAPFADAFTAACGQFFERLESAQSVLGTCLPPGSAERCDAASLVPNAALFDAAVTSPPYAMALPYIDTQRLSLVWLGLLDPADVPRLESELIGSRELRGAARRKTADALEGNADGLPEAEARLCRRLRDSLNGQDGFRRKAVPVLLYRYFASMRNSFRAVRGVMRSGAPFALIVGHNHTVLGGTRYDIDTPSHLAALAAQTGWKVDELMPLQAYRRYGYHVGNAVRAETLVVLSNP